MSRKCLIHKIVFLLPAVTAAAALAALIPQLAGTENMPQQNSGDPLAVLLGDVRTLVSNEMITKADQYYHGGVTEVEHCSHGDGHFHGDHDSDDEDEHECHDHHDHDEKNESDSALYDPWAAFKHAIRLPNEDRHLVDEKSRELFPWFWASIRLNPKNTRAYLNAAYVMETSYEMPEKALDILNAGLDAIPEDAELEFAKGLLLLNKQKRTADAVDSFRKAITDLKDKTDDDSLVLKLRSLEFLGKIAFDNGDSSTLQNCVEKAEVINPDHSCTKYLKSLMTTPRQ